MNSLRGPTVPQASLAHHLTAIPDEGLCTSELVKQMSEQAREGGGVKGWRGFTRLQQLQLDLPACLHTSAITAPCPSISNSFPSSLSCRCIFFSKCSLRIHLYFSLSLPISLVHSRSRNPIVLLENSLFLNWIGRLSSRCTNRVLSSCADRQKTVKMTFKLFQKV